jgi:ATP-dependent Clp protease adaptor protein ClpS
MTTRETTTMSDMYEDDDIDAGTAVLDRDEIDIEEPKTYACVLLNDNWTTASFVVDVLRDVFHKPEDEAVIIMRDVHNKGRGVGYIGTYDICITKKAIVEKMARDLGYPFKIEVEEC